VPDEGVVDGPLPVLPETGSARLPRRRPLIWPTWRRARAYLLYGICVELAFVVVYFGANALAARRAVVAHLYLPWELAIPFVPWMLWIYLSIAVLLLLPLFQLEEEAIALLARRMLLGTALAGVVFLAVPAELGFARTEPAGGYARAFAILYVIDRPHNLVPSLHIVYSALILFALAEAAPSLWRAVCHGWLLLITVSLPLVHQHHLADIAGGYALVWLCHRVISGPPRLRRGTWPLPLAEAEVV